MAEIAAFAELFRVPVPGEFDLRVLLAGSGKEDEAEAAFLDVEAAEVLEAEFVAIKVQRLVEVADAHHGVQIFHR